MSDKRINAVPPPGIPRHAIPLYALPSGDVIYNTSALQIIRGVILPNPATVRYHQPLSQNQTVAFRFTVRNPVGNPVATITNNSVSGDIELIDLVNSVGDPTGIILQPGDEFEIVFFTDFTLGDLIEGSNGFSGQWNLFNTFVGINGEFQRQVTMFYDVIVPKTITRRLKGIPPSIGKLAPHGYVDSYDSLNRQVSETRGREPNTPGYPDSSRRNQE